MGRPDEPGDDGKWLDRQPVTHPAKQPQQHCGFIGVEHGQQSPLQFTRRRQQFVVDRPAGRGQQIGARAARGGLLARPDQALGFEAVPAGPLAHARWLEHLAQLLCHIDAQSGRTGLVGCRILRP